MAPGPSRVPVAPAQSQAQRGCGAVGGAFAESSMSRGGPVHAGDMIGEIALAIEMGADAVDMSKIIHPHPTLGESIGMAAEVAHGSCTDLPPIRK